MDISLNGKKPPDDIKVKAKLKELKVLKPIISKIIKINKVNEKYKIKTLNLKIQIPESQIPKQEIQHSTSKIKKIKT